MSLIITGRALFRHIGQSVAAYSQVRSLGTSRRSKYRRILGGGAIPGIRYGGKISTEMSFRGQSILDSIRTPKPVMDPIKRWRILRGDFVEITSGPHKGKRGTVLEVIRASNRVVVEGVGFVTKYVPRPDSSRKTPTVTEAPIPVSRVQIVCPETNKPTRIVYAFLDDGTKVRVSKKSGCIVPRPEILSKRRLPRPEANLTKDTPASIVLKRTFEDENNLYGEKYGSFKELIEKALPSLPP